MLDTSIRFDFDEFSDVEVFVLAAAAAECAGLTTGRTRVFFEDLAVIAQAELQRRGGGIQPDLYRKLAARVERVLDADFLKGLKIDPGEPAK